MLVKPFYLYTTVLGTKNRLAVSLDIHNHVGLTIACDWMKVCILLPYMEDDHVDAWRCKHRACARLPQASSPSRQVKETHQLFTMTLYVSFWRFLM